MTRTLSILLLAAAALFFIPVSVTAGLHRCEGCDDYKPRRGVMKISSWPIKVQWEERQHCLPCGRTIPYRVKVITFRERYTDGTQRTWKCVVSGSEVTLG